MNYYLGNSCIYERSYLSLKASSDVTQQTKVKSPETLRATKEDLRDVDFFLSWVGLQESPLVITLKAWVQF